MQRPWVCSSWVRPGPLAHQLRVRVTAEVPDPQGRSSPVMLCPSTGCKLEGVARNPPSEDQNGALGRGLDRELGKWERTNAIRDGALHFSGSGWTCRRRAWDACLGRSSWGSPLSPWHGCKGGSCDSGPQKQRPSSQTRRRLVPPPSALARPRLASRGVQVWVPQLERDTDSQAGPEEGG